MKVPAFMVVDSLITLSARDRLRGLSVFFLVLVLLVAGAVYLLVEFNGRQRYYVTFFMISPAIAAFAAMRVIGADMVLAGLKLPRFRDGLTTYLLPVFYGLVMYIPIWLFFSGGYGNPEAAKQIGQWLGLNTSDRTVIYAFFTVVMMTIGFVLQLTPFLGTEIGLRGFFATIILPKTSFLVAAALSGVLYTAMHIPLFYLTDMNAGPEYIPLQITGYLVSAMAAGVIGLYYRMKSGSVLPGAILHASHAAFIVFALGEATTKTAETWRYGGEFGMFVPLVLVPVAFRYWRLARKAGY